MTHLTPGGLVVYDEIPDTLGGIMRVQESSTSGVWLFYANNPAVAQGPHLNGEQIDRVIAALLSAKARQYPDGAVVTKGE